MRRTSLSLPVLSPFYHHPTLTLVLENRTLTSADKATTRFKGAQDFTKVMMDLSCIE